MLGNRLAFKRGNIGLGMAQVAEQGVSLNLVKSDDCDIFVAESGGGMIIDRATPLAIVRKRSFQDQGNHAKS